MSDTTYLLALELDSRGDIDRIPRPAVVIIPARIIPRSDISAIRRARNTYWFRTTRL